MKKILTAVLLSLSCIAAAAQEIETPPMRLDSIIGIFINMRDAAADKNREQLAKCAEELKGMNLDYELTEDNIPKRQSSLKGHLIFNEYFADSLAAGKEAYENADIIMRNTRSFSVSRGTSGYHSKTLFVKAGKRIKYSFKAQGKQEVAAVAEAGGLLTLNIHISNNNGLNRYIKETKDAKIGKPQRKKAFELPKTSNNVEVEVINCGKKDITFVLIYT